MVANFAPPSGARINWNHPLSNGLTSCYLFNEGGGQRPLDIANNRNIGLIANPKSIGGQYGPALGLNGSTQYGDTSSAINAFPVSFTYSIWFNASTVAVKQVLMGRNVQGSGLEISAGGKPNFYSFGTAGVTGVGANAPAYVVNKWYHVAGTYDNNTISLYVNGILVDTLIAGANFSRSSSSTMRFGANGAWAGLVNFFNGNLANARIYNRAISSQEAMQLYINPYAGINPNKKPNIFKSNFKDTFVFDKNYRLYLKKNAELFEERNKEKLEERRLLRETIERAAKREEEHNIESKEDIKETIHKTMDPKRWESIDILKKKLAEIEDELELMNSIHKKQLLARKLDDEISILLLL